MIGWYVHHHGSGHLHRMRTVAAALEEEVTVLSSLPRPADEPRAWLQLARDDDGPAGSERDPTARGTLHWVPRHDGGLASRAAQIATWIADARPRLLVVDVSVEVTLLARLCGVPVVLMAMPGDREDRPHALAYDLAEALIAPWPPGLPSTWPPHRSARTAYVGAISRFDGRTATGPRRPGTAYLLWGSGGEREGGDVLDQLRSAAPEREWIGTGSTRDPHQVWRNLCEAEVVVTHAGQNAVAEVAAARAPAVLVADPRPFGEQEHTVQRLRHLGIGIALPKWPAQAQWPTLLSQAVSRGGASWQQWHDGCAAQRACAALGAVLDPRSRMAPS